MGRVISAILIFSLMFISKHNGQDLNDTSAFSKFEFSFLTGANFSDKTGFTLSAEMKTNINAKLKLRTSLSYTSLYQDVGKNIKSYIYFPIDNNPDYSTNEYRIIDRRFLMLPITIGLEYILVNNEYTPYGLFEIGYNLYAYNTNMTARDVNFYDSIEQIPVGFNPVTDDFSSKNSYKIALGFGAYFPIGKDTNIDLRFVYNINTQLVNSGQMLVGINI